MGFVVTIHNILLLQLLIDEFAESELQMISHRVEDAVFTNSSRKGSFIINSFN
jgi:hypothetical protein